MRGPVLAVLVLGVCGVCPAQRFRFTPADKSVVLQRVADAPASNKARESRIKDLFEQAGCSGAALTEQPVAGSDTPNLICRLNGTSDETIIVGAHYQHDPSAGAARDNWSAASLLPSIYQSVAGQRRHHTLLFIAFADNGNGQGGAGFYAGHMTQREVAQTEALLNLDVLGLSPTKVWTHNSDKDLVHDLIVVAYLLKLPLSQVDIVDSSPTGPFEAKQIPLITIHSLTHANLAGESVAFRPHNYVDSYHLVSGYLAYLDTILKSRTNAK
jgi:hypothetical protein